MHNEIVSFLNSKVSGCQATVNVATVGDGSISVSSTHIFDVCKNLKESSEFNFNVLQVITGTDYLDTKEIEISYVLASYTKNLELILKTRLPRQDKNNLPK